MLNKKKVIQRFLEGLEKLADKGKQELAQQGHRATGKGIASIEAKITSQSLDKLVGVILANDYLIPVDLGVSASRIPFGQGGGGKSKYIQGLINWVSVIKPGLSEKKKLSFVFAIAKTHKREGMPSRGSYSYTRNGRRKNWIQFGLEDNAQTFEEEFRLFDLIVDSFEKSIASALAA